MDVIFIAEVSSNHNRNLDRCMAFIEKAVEIGCNAVKFQLFKVPELFAPEILAKSEKHRLREEWELPVEFLPMLASCCREAGIHFICTPFYLAAVNELSSYVDFYKIASYELLWDDLLMAIARTGKPVILSTGMATLSEVHSAVAILCQAGCKDLTLLHCVSSYPAPPDQCNLSAIERLRNSLSFEPSALNLRFGWSDHSVNAGVIYRAVHHWNASIVEFHMDIDGKGEEYSTGHCWLPEQIEPVIQAIHAGLQADGSGQKIAAPSELKERQWRADPSDGLRPLWNKRAEWRL